VAWASALERIEGPSALCLSRQNLPRLVQETSRAKDIARGGYVLSDMPGAQAVILATGSEVSLAMAAQAELALEGIATRVVSMPCTSRFDRQPPSYQDEVLAPHLPAVAVEAAHPDFWRKYVGRSGGVVGIASFGESAPARDLCASASRRRASEGTAAGSARHLGAGARAGAGGMSARAADCSTSSCSTWTVAIATAPRSRRSQRHTSASGWRRFPGAGGAWIGHGMRELLAKACLAHRQVAGRAVISATSAPCGLQ
jgi:hypothetical protein